MSHPALQPEPEPLFTPEDIATMDAIIAVLRLSELMRDRLPDVVALRARVAFAVGR